MRIKTHNRILTLSLIGSCIGMDAAANTQIIQNFTGFSGFTDYQETIYVPGEIWKNETHYNTYNVGGVLAIDNTLQKEFLASAPVETKSVESIYAILSWFSGNNRKSARQLFDKNLTVKPDNDDLFCDQSVAIIRTLLHAQGYISRPVIFEFGDGKGGASHTAMEVWDSQQKKWLYVDPHTLTMAKNKNTAELIMHPSRLTYVNTPTYGGLTLEDRKKFMAELLQTGWHEMYVDSSDGAIRYKYKQ